MDSNQKKTPTTGSDPHREEAIFDAAVALPAEHREAYLEKVCGGDSQLRLRIELLLRSNDRAGEFLEPAQASGGNPTMVVSVPPAERPGDVIGHYKIREKLSTRIKKGSFTATSNRRTF